MQEKKFKKYLENRKIKIADIEIYLLLIREFDEYLKALGAKGVDTSLYKSTKNYVNERKFSKNEKEIFYLALKNYGLAIEKAHVVGNANKLLGKSTWMVRLENTLDGYVGRELREKIMNAGGLIKDTSSVEKKASWTKCMVDCLEENIDEETCKKILTNNLHYKSPKSPSFKKLRKMYLKTKNIDEVLEHMHSIWKERIGKRYGYDSLEYKQVVNDPTIEAGKREGNIIYVSKIPFQLSEYLRAKNDKMKRYHYCHCGWVRASIPKTEEDRISSKFCYCSGGWHKIPFEAIFEQELEVELINSVLKGDENCLFAIHLPEDVMTGEE
ncbi:MAG TPA: DUF6144 family protein [candidate division Zixibacteria bacterium]|nr:DUF6144 family protein [candidate division Zixibacteria bacterium]